MAASRKPSSLFPQDEMSTGETSSMRRRAHAMTGNPDRPVAPTDPGLQAVSTTGKQPALDPETVRLQAELRARAATDSGRTAVARPSRPNRAAPAPVADTFVRRKMQQAQDNVAGIDLDEDLG